MQLCSAASQILKKIRQPEWHQKSPSKYTCSIAALHRKSQLLYQELMRSWFRCNCNMVIKGAKKRRTHHSRVHPASSLVRRGTQLPVSDIKPYSLLSVRLKLSRSSIFKDAANNDVFSCIIWKHAMMLSIHNGQCATYYAGMVRAVSVHRTWSGLRSTECWHLGYSQ